jgi:hypothetical protein
MDYILCEENSECPSGHYWYLFSYGNSQLWIAGVYFVWSYHETQEEAKARHDAYDLIVDRNKQTSEKEEHEPLQSN